MVREKRWILVVEDELGLQKLIRRRAEREGLGVIETRTTQKGFALAASMADVMLIDLHLPDGNGIALLQRLKGDARTRQRRTRVAGHGSAPQRRG